ncbi:MAG: hypothetical protein PSX81_09965 [bacterium]|nr:hypothetical protein [bacterium]
MGIKNPRHRSDKEIELFRKENIFYQGIQLHQLNNYYAYFDSLTQKSPQIVAQDSFKVLMQPLEAMYFDTLGILESILVNCYAVPDKFDLNWNTKNRLDFFPPTTHVTFFRHINIYEILKLTNAGSDVLKLDNGKRKVVIFWNIFLNKQTKIYLKAIQDNLAKAKGEIQVFFINNDNSFFANS